MYLGKKIICISVILKMNIDIIQKMHGSSDTIKTRKKSGISILSQFASFKGKGGHEFKSSRII